MKIDGDPTRGRDPQVGNRCNNVSYNCRPLSPGPVLLGGECCTTLVPPNRTCSLPWVSMSSCTLFSTPSTGSCGGIHAAVCHKDLLVQRIVVSKVSFPKYAGVVRIELVIYDDNVQLYLYIKNLHCSSKFNNKSFKLNDITDNVVVKKMFHSYA